MLGNLNKSEMNDLKKTNVSMGLMLENSSHRLLEKEMPHHDAPSKDPRARIQILKNAGEIKNTNDYGNFGWDRRE